MRPGKKVADCPAMSFVLKQSVELGDQLVEVKVKVKLDDFGLIRCTSEKPKRICHSNNLPFPNYDRVGK